MMQGLLYPVGPGGGLGWNHEGLLQMAAGEQTLGGV